jgi:hypothetical protein
LTLASSAMADESNAVKAYKEQVKGPIFAWSSQMSNRVAAYGKLREDLAKLKKTDPAYAAKKAQAIELFRIMNSDSNAASLAILGLVAHTSDKSEISALPGYVKGLIDAKGKSFKDKGIIVNTTALWGGKENTEGPVIVTITLGDI